MSYNIVIIEEAKIDYKESLLWYKDINSKLAIRFNDSFKRSITILKKIHFNFK